MLVCEKKVASCKALSRVHYLLFNSCSKPYIKWIIVMGYLATPIIGVENRNKSII